VRPLAPWIVLLGLLAPSLGHAQDTATNAEPSGTGVRTEDPDATRLDVERLPPEAIRITRDLYAHGFFLEGAVGGRGWIGGIGRLSSPGPYASIGFGVEIFDWLFVRAVGELEIHETSAPAPPDTAAFEILSALGEVKLQVSPTPELGLWLAGLVGVSAGFNDLLVLYGMRNATTVGLAWGGDLGVDAHFHSRHYSIGVLGGVRGAPNFDGEGGEIALGVHGAAYLRYVF
jgi:hypothetical protein